MEFAAVIIIAAAAALAGAAGLGAGIALRRWRDVSYPAYWFAIAGAVVGAVASAAIIGDWGRAVLGAGEQIAVDEVLPYMAAIKTSEPALYERIETSIVRDRTDGKSADEVRSNAKALVSSYVADKIAFLPNDLIYELYATTRDILGYLEEREDFTTCAEVALGRFKGDIDPRLSGELVQRNDNTTLRVIAAKANKDAARMRPEEFAVLASNTFAQATQIIGIGPEEVDTLLAGEGDPVKTCKLMKAFIDTLLAQPVEVAASALRTLASGGSPATPPPNSP
jgi:hypothetical protein